MEQTTAVLCTYSGEPLRVLGCITVSVFHRDQQVDLPLLIVKGNGPTLLGRNYLEKLKLDWTPYKQLQWNL